MEQLTIIKSKKQYFKYCDELEHLTEEKETKAINERIELLLLLIEKWDREHHPLKNMDPVQLLKALMEEHTVRSVDLANELKIDKTALSKILHYYRGFSKEIIQKLASYFKVNQEAFNRPYQLIDETNKHFKDAKLMNTVKKLQHV